jgi:small subunit ribosomal protein S16
MGAKKRPFYRVVVKEKRSKRDGKYLENLGTYDPLQDPAEVNLNHERIHYWISVGAKPTDTVASLIKHNPEMSAEEREAMLKERAEKKLAAEKARLEAKKAEEARLVAEAEEKALAEKAEAEAQAAAAAETAGDSSEASVEESSSETAPAEEAPVAETPVEEEKPEKPAE